jgi:hypothetical protein
VTAWAWSQAVNKNMLCCGSRAHHTAHQQGNGWEGCTDAKLQRGHDVCNCNCPLVDAAMRYKDAPTCAARLCRLCAAARERWRDAPPPALATLGPAVPPCNDPATLATLATLATAPAGAIAPCTAARPPHNAGSPPAAAQAVSASQSSASAVPAALVAWARTTATHDPTTATHRVHSLVRAGAEACNHDLDYDVVWGFGRFGGGGAGGSRGSGAWPRMRQ